MISLNWHCQELFIIIKKKKKITVFVMKTLLKLQSAYSPGGIFMLLLNEHTLCFVIIKPPMRAGLVAWLSSNETEVSFEQISPIQWTTWACT